MSAIFPKFAKNQTHTKYENISDNSSYDALYMLLCPEQYVRYIR